MSRYPRKDDPNGEKVIPSVTQIISACTPMPWAIAYGAKHAKDYIRENVGQEEIGIYPVTDEHLAMAKTAAKRHSKHALDVGSEVHNAVEMHLQGKDFNLTTKEAENSFNAFLEWESENTLEVISLEKTVYGNGWAGTLDIDTLLNKKRYIIDLKTSARMYPEMRYQVAAYRWGVSQNNKVEGCGVLRLDKETGKGDWLDTSDTYWDDLEIWDAMVDLYFKRHPRIRKQARGE